MTDRLTDRSEHVNGRSKSKVESEFDWAYTGNTCHQQYWSKHLLTLETTTQKIVNKKAGEMSSTDGTKLTLECGARKAEENKQSGEDVLVLVQTMHRLQHCIGHGDNEEYQYFPSSKISADLIKGQNNTEQQQNTIVTTQQNTNLNNTQHDGFSWWKHKIPVHVAKS